MIKTETKTLPMNVEEELLSIKRRLELAQQAGRVGSFEWDLLNNTYFLTPELEELYGLPEGGFKMLKNWSDIIHPEDRESAQKAVEAAVKGKADLANEFRVVWPDGSIRWLHSRAKVVKDENGKPIKMYGVNVDITQQKLAEDRAVREGKKFLTLIENSSAGILLLDASGKIITFGHSVLGYKAEDKIGKSILDVIHPEDKGKVLEEIKNLAVTPGQTHTAQYRAMHKKGDWRWIEAVITNLLHDPNIGAVVVNYRDITERVEAEKIIKEKSTKDYLTGILNRHAFQDILEETIEKIKEGDIFSVLFLDLDRFKNVNDTLGHEVGDRVLEIISKRLAKTVNDLGVIGRLGGDEFGILVPDKKDRSKTLKLAKELLKTFKEVILIDDHQLFIEGSMGITSFPKDGTYANDLLRNADIALYRAKDEGRNNYRFYNDAMKTSAAKKLLLEQKLRAAPENKELFLEYQPIIDIETNQIVSLEALIRWKHPTMGTMYPNQFIPLAEETGVIKTLGRWALDEVIKDHKSWQKSYEKLPQITLNVSCAEFIDPALTKRINSVLRKSKMDPKYIEFEITESTAMKEIHKTKEKLDVLARMGVGIIMDDFGTGYSSLGNLQRFPLHKLKIDKSFITNCTKSESDAAIVRAIISMAHSLGLKVVAEGVENKDQLDFIRAYDCDYVQGFLFGKPQRADQVVELF